jgi:hypothetical protein
MRMSLRRSSAIQQCISACTSATERRSTNYFKEENIIVPIHVQYELRGDSVADGVFMDEVTSTGRNEKVLLESCRMGSTKRCGLARSFTRYPLTLDHSVLMVCGLDG